MEENRFAASIGLRGRGIHVLLYSSKGELAVMLWGILSDLGNKPLRVLSINDYDPSTNDHRAYEKFMHFAEYRIRSRREAEDTCKEEDATSAISNAGDGSIWIIFVNNIEEASMALSGARQILAAPCGCILVVPHCQFQLFQEAVPNVADFWMGQIDDVSEMLPSSLSLVPHPEWKTVMEHISCLPGTMRLSDKYLRVVES